MSRGYKKQANDSIHDPIPLTFVEWLHQAHTEHNTSLAAGWERYRQARRERVREQLREAMERKREKCKQVTYQPEPRYDEVYYEGLAWLDGIDEEICACGKSLTSDAELVSGECEDCMLSERPESNAGSPPEMPEIVSGSLSAGVPEGDGDYTVWPRMERKIDRIREEGLG